MSLSEGNAKTCLEQSPVTDSRKAYGPHKSTVTTQRKSVQSVRSVKSVLKKKIPIRGSKKYDKERAHVRVYIIIYIAKNR